MRMWQWLLIAIVCTAGSWAVAPQQLEILLWKANLLTALFWLGYWLDRTAFPYARPHTALDVSCGATWQLRRAIIVAATVIGGCIAI